MQLQFSPWKIEQHVFDPVSEPELEKQLAISNGYISQNACFDEHYSGAAEAFTYFRGLAVPMPSGNMISVRLREESLDLATWQVQKFYRSQFRQEPRLERSFTATSPSGATFRVESHRWMSPANPHLIFIEYELTSVDYDGPVSLLSLLGHSTAYENWYPLSQAVEPEYVAFWLQSRVENVRLAMASSFLVTKNGEPVTTPFIRIEKRYIGGYSVTEHVAPGDTILLRRTTAITDSRNFPSEHLLADAIAML